jgi:nucleoside-diphosphate-sugar epimerase
MGASLAGRLFLVFGDGARVLPLVHVDDVVDAIIACMEDGAADNQTFNLVDRASISKRMYMDCVVKPLHPNAIVIYVPMPMILGLTRLQETLLGFFGRPPPLSLYRLMSSQMRVRFSASRIESVLGWRSRIAFAQGAEQLISGRANP